MSDQHAQPTRNASIPTLLIEAAERILEHDGPGGLSVRRIANHAGVAPMGVYNHFDGKMGIIDALYQRGFSRLDEAMSTISLIADPIEALREGGRRYRRLAIVYPMSYQLMFLRPIPGFVPSPEARKVATDSFTRVVEAVARAVAEGCIRAFDPTLVAQILWASSHGWVSLQICGFGYIEEWGAGATALSETLWRGFGIEPAR